MDLLGSILGSMEKPPTASNDQRKKEKEKREKLEKLQDEERKNKAKFREDVEDQITKFINNPEKSRHKFSPMNKLQRTIVHDVAEIAGLIGQAFGKEDEGRYIIIFKKEYSPSEEELAAYRKGEEWNPEDEKEKKEQKPEEKLVEKKTVKATNAEPSSNYKDKYRHLIGTTSAKDAARKTEANKAFGMVPSENKRDVRSIEETMNEIRKKKRQKIENEEET